MKRFFTGLDEIRNRPLRERRAMGLAVYLAAAAVAVALWLPSFRNALELRSLASPIGQTSSAKATAGEEDKKSALPPAGFISPWQALKAVVNQGFSELRNISLESEGTLTKEAATAKAALTSTSTQRSVTNEIKSEASKNKGVAKKTGAETKKALRFLAPPASPTPGEILSKSLNNQPLELEEMSRLAAPPRQSNAGATQPQSELMAIIRSNVGELRQAAADFYEYLAE